MTRPAPSRLRILAVLLLALAAAGAATAGAAEAYPILAAMEIAVFAAGVLALVPSFAREGERAGGLPPEVVRSGYALAALLAVALLQLSLPPPATVPVRGMKLALGSLAPTETGRETLKLAAYLVAFLLAGWAAASRRLLDLTLVPIVSAAAILAAYGLVQLLSGRALPEIYPHRLWGYADRLASTYVNPNHFAGLLEMTLPLSIALAVSRLPPGRRYLAAPSRRRRLADLLTNLARSPSALLWTGVSVLLGVALLFTRSRLGIVSGFAALLFLGFTARRRRRGFLALGLFLALLLGGLAALEEDPLSGRFDRLDRDVELRLRVQEDVLTAIRTRYGLTGAGLGSFLSTFSQFQTAYPRSEFAAAHDDYLQMLYEAGVLGGVPAALFLVFVLVGAFRRMRGDSGGARPYAAGAAAAVVAILVHSVGDFNLQVPANGLVFSIVAGVAAGAGGVRVDHPPSFPLHRAT